MSSMLVPFLDCCVDMLGMRPFADVAARVLHKMPLQACSYLSGRFLCSLRQHAPKASTSVSAASSPELWQQHPL